MKIEFSFRAVEFTDCAKSSLFNYIFTLGKRVDDPLPVHLSVDILSFDQIDTVNMMIAYVF